MSYKEAREGGVKEGRRWGERLEKNGEMGEKLNTVNSKSVVAKSGGINVIWSIEQRIFLQFTLKTKAISILIKIIKK